MNPLWFYVGAFRVGDVFPPLGRDAVALCLGRPAGYVQVGVAWKSWC